MAGSFTSGLRLLGHKSRDASVDKPIERAHVPGVVVKSREVKVHFEQEGSQLTAVEIGQSGRSPLIVALHRTLFALGVVVSSYQVRPSAQGGLVERVVLQRRDGGMVQGSLGDRARAAILPIALSAEPKLESA